MNCKHRIGLVQCGATFFVSTFVVYLKFLLRINVSAVNPALHQAAARCDEIPPGFPTTSRRFADEQPCGTVRQQAICKMQITSQIASTLWAIKQNRQCTFIT